MTDSPASQTSLNVNGDDVLVDTPANAPLLSALREELGLLGARTGCGIGECGSCTVLVDGTPTRSCITPVSSAAGTRVVTPEGLGTPDCPSPVQQAFIDEQAAQCGFCINGMIMTVHSMVGQPHVDEGSIADALGEHICRCGTHSRIIRAACRALTQDSYPAQAPGPDLVVRDTTAQDSGASAASVPIGSPVEARLRLRADGRVEVLAGKVELGQGIVTAFAQIAAAQLRLPVDHVVVRPASSAEGPDDGYTSGSASLEDSGIPLAASAQAFRRLLLERAGSVLGVEPQQLTQEAERFVAADGSEVTLAQLAEPGPIAGTVATSDVPDWALSPLGRDVPRTDLPAKVTGSPAYVHDLELPGMLHVRVLLPRTYEAELLECDLEDARAAPGVTGVVRDGNFALVLAERSYQATNAVVRLRRGSRWSDTRLSTDGYQWLHGEPTDSHTPRTDPVPELDDPGASITATYSKPYEAHAPVAPSCAVALEHDGGLTVWTHSQGIYPLRQELAVLLDRDESSITVHHRDGPGCYGHNAADDAAAFAAVAAQHSGGRPVRFQFAVQDEFLWEPYASGMEARLEAALDGSRSIAAWRHVSLTDLHHARPDGTGDRLIPAWLRQKTVPRPRPRMGDPGSRNAVPLYDIPGLDVRAYFVRGPLRTSSLRSLGAYLNVFASESFMDEVAELAREDPLAFRLRHLTDARAREVLELAADRAGWEPHVGPSGRGQGIAVCRYKNTRAYVAMVVDVAVDAASAGITVRRVVLACDAGSVVNPDGLRNQLEGGVLQGLSRSMYEKVTYDVDGIQTLDWTSFPVLRFADVPPIEVTLVDRRGEPPLGAGEASTPPLPAALANAIDDAVGIRMRDLPITPTRLQQRLMAMSGPELDRVRA